MNLPFLIERIEGPATPDGGEGLLAVVIRTGDYTTDDLKKKTGATFLTPPELALQAAFLYHVKGDKVQPHYHPPVPRTLTGTPEMLLVLEGEYMMDVYTTPGELVGSRLLTGGCIVILLAGGHGFRCLTDDAGMMEVKVGPYRGVDDKIPITPK